MNNEKTHIHFLKSVVISVLLKEFSLFALTSLALITFMLANTKGSHLQLFYLLTFSTYQDVQTICREAVGTGVRSESRDRSLLERPRALIKLHNDSIVTAFFAFLLRKHFLGDALTNRHSSA